MTSTLRQGAEPILLAFSGGLDTSFCVPWLKDTYRRPVITVTVDTGGIDTAAAESLRSEEHTSELQSQSNNVCRLLLEKKKKILPSLFRKGGDNTPAPSTCCR